MELDDVLEAMRAGQFDGQLEPIVEAAVERAREGAVEFMWRLTLDGDTWTQETVTLGELKFAEQHCMVDGVDNNGRPYKRRATRVEIDPRITAEHALALIIAHLHKAQGMTLQQAIKRAEAVTASELTTVVGEFEVVRPPKDDSPTSTDS